MKLSMLSAGLMPLVLLASATDAAVSRNEQGQGQALIYPYYTASNGWSTLFSVVNASGQATAIKVKLREGRAGQEAQSINVYLAAGDVWTAALYSPQQGVIALTSSDPSCTVPAIVGNTALPSDETGNRYLPLDPTPLADGRELNDNFVGFDQELQDGFVEVVQMGMLANEPSAAASNNDCDLFIDRWQTDGAWTASPGQDVQPPEGGLSGSISYVHAIDARALGSRAVALEGVLFSDQHTAPSDSAPSVATGDLDAANTTSLVYVDGESVTTHWQRPIDAIHAVLFADMLSNEFQTSGGIVSEWIVTLPTKPSILTSVQRPFDEGYGEVSPGEACISIGAFGLNGFPITSGTVYDRDGNMLLNPDQCTESGSLDDSEGIGLNLCVQRTFCEVTNNIEFNGTSMFQSARPMRIDTHSAQPSAANGWANLWFLGQTTLTDPSGDNPNQEGHVFRGLPAVGFLASGLSADQIISGVVSNFGVAHPHVATRSICTFDCDD